MPESFSSILTPLFEPEAFHTEIYKKLYHNHVVSLVEVQTQG